MVARSSTELEYRAFTQVAAEIDWIQSLLQEMSVALSSYLIIWYDNQSASSLTANPIYNAQTKHIELKIHLVRDKVLEKTLKICYVPSCDQITDGLIKRCRFNMFSFSHKHLV